MAKKWQDMTRTERRVAVAKDVIKHIHAGTFYARSVYGRATGLERGDKSDQARAKEILNSGACEACARGALLLCKVAKYNNTRHVIEPEVAPCSQYSTTYNACSQTTTRGLKDCFTEAQLVKIEDVFEGCDDDWNEIIDPADRLLAICQNIIDHEGNFEPNEVYEIV